MTAEQIAETLMLSSLRNNIQRLSDKSLRRVTEAVGLEFELYGASIQLDHYWGYAWRVVDAENELVAKGEAQKEEIARRAMRDSIMAYVEESVRDGYVDAYGVMNALLCVQQPGGLQ